MIISKYTSKGFLKIRLTSFECFRHAEWEGVTQFLSHIFLPLYQHTGTEENWLK